MDNNRVYAIIVAAGSGTRMGMKRPKQFLELEGVPILRRTVSVFQQAIPSIHIILALPPAYEPETRELLKEELARGRIDFVEGGATRFHSVKQALLLVQTDGIVLVHDAVRCLVSPALLKAAVDAAVLHKSVVPVVPITNSIRKIHGENSYPVSREEFVFVQTPQAFEAGLLKKAYEVEYRESFTDDASVVELSGARIVFIPGEETNIKITTAKDLILAAFFLGHPVPSFKEIIH